MIKNVEIPKDIMLFIINIAEKIIEKNVGFSNDRRVMVHYGGHGVNVKG